jgi:hypothetical protein
MYLKKRKINGQYYWSLVESYREDGKVKQRVIQSLGNTHTALKRLENQPEYRQYYYSVLRFFNSLFPTPRFYFVFTGASSVEYEVVSDLRPPRLLLSFHYFRTKRLDDVVERLGYNPLILLDSGAYSAHTKGKNFSVLDYMSFIKQNSHHIERYIALDVVGDSELTHMYYLMMRSKGFDPIPVFHYGENRSYLERYLKKGEKYIALGGTVGIKDKKKVADWINSLARQYPDIQFHLLGSSSPQIMSKSSVYSCDSSTWMLKAINGYPKHIKGRSREAKAKRARYQMEKMMLSLDAS